MRNGSGGRRGPKGQDQMIFQLWIKQGERYSEKKKGWHKVYFILMIIQLFLRKDKTKVRKNSKQMGVSRIYYTDHKN